MSSGEYCYEMPLEGLNRPFCLVRSFGEWRHELLLAFLCYEVLVQTLRGFVVHDLELDVVSELGKPPVLGAGVGVDDSGFAAAGQELDVNVAFVDR